MTHDTSRLKWATDESVITHHAKMSPTIVLITSHFVQFRKNSAQMTKFRGRGQIPRLRSKFRGPRKTEGPNNGSQIYHDPDLSRSRKVIGHVINRSAICHFLLVSHWNRISICNRFRNICIRIYIYVTTLTFLGHVTLSVTWPIDPPYAISYWHLIGTEPLSLTVFEIFGTKFALIFTPLRYVPNVAKRSILDQCKYA